MQKGENGVFKGFPIDLPGQIWYAKYVEAAEKSLIFYSFLQLTVVEKIQNNWQVLVFYVKGV